MKQFHLSIVHNYFKFNIFYSLRRTVLFPGQLQKGDKYIININRNIEINIIKKMLILMRQFQIKSFLFKTVFHALCNDHKLINSIKQD